MTRKRILIDIVLVGFLLALGSNAWADRGRHGQRHHYNGENHRDCYKAHHGHYYGWYKGKKHLHRDRYQHRKGYRHRDRDRHWSRDRRHRWHHYRDRYYKGRHHRKRVVEKHVYHHYPQRHRYDDDRSRIAFVVIDQVLGVAVAVGGTH